MKHQIVPIDKVLYTDVMKYLPKKWTDNVTAYDGKQYGINVGYILENGGTNAMSADCAKKYNDKVKYAFWCLYVILLTVAGICYLHFNINYIFVPAVAGILLLELHSLTIRSLKLERCKYANAVVKEISFTIIRYCDSEIIVSERDKNIELKKHLDALLVDVAESKNNHIKLYQFLLDNSPKLATKFANKHGGLPIEYDTTLRSDKIH